MSGGETHELESSAASVRTFPTGGGTVTSALCRLCAWHRHFATERNGVTKLAEHLMAKHRVRLVLASDAAVRR